MLRYRFNRVTLPICLSVMLSLAAATALVGAFIKPMFWAILPFSLFVASLIALVAISSSLAEKELSIELSRWSYLFENDLSIDAEELETDDPETEIKYTLTEKGLRYLLPIKTEQVFDEARENEFFLPWTDVEIVVATDNFARRVRLAAAVIDVSKRSVNGRYIPTDKEIHFLPLDKELVAFFQKYGLDKKISVEWRYIRLQPRDSFKQILSRGYIRSLKDENGKRVKREHADDLYRE